MTRLSNYNMECYPYEAKRFDSWSYGLIQPKYDGDRVRVVIQSGEATLYSSSGRVITSLPHLNKEFKEIYSNAEYLELDGEVYCHEMKHPEISGIVRTIHGTPNNFDKLKYYVFDLPKLGMPLISRLQNLKGVVTDSPNIIIAPTYTVKESSEIQEFLKEFYSNGFEGFVLKNPFSMYETKRSVNWLKCKPRRSDSYRVIGFIEEVSKDGEYKDTLGALILDSGKGSFNVGTGFTSIDRDFIWNNKEKFLGTMFTITYQELSNDGIPREPSAKLT